MFTSRFLIDSVYAIVFVLALSVVAHDVWLGFHRRENATTSESESTQGVSWRTGLAMITLAWLPLVVAIVSGGF
jgi:hypothetical protein